MPNAIQNDRQACPRWCAGEHPDPTSDHDGFHHSALIHTVPVSRVEAVPEVRIRISKFEPGSDDDRRHYPEQVELVGADNSGSIDLTLLTADEAMQVADGLEAGARWLRDEQDRRRKLGVAHPDWCSPGWCTVRRGEVPEFPDVEQGSHIGPVATVMTEYGSRLQLGLTVEAASGDRPPQVRLFSAALDNAENDGHEERMHPEEARLLARRLLDAADACERAF